MRQNRRSPRASLLASTLLFIAACAGTPPEQPSIEETRAELQAYIASERVKDDRGRFREIFCAVLEDHGGVEEVVGTDGEQEQCLDPLQVRVGDDPLQQAGPNALSAMFLSDGQRA